MPAPVETSARARLAWLLELLSGARSAGPAELAEHVAAEALAVVGRDRYAAQLASMAAELAPITVDRLAAGSPYDALARIRDRDGRAWSLRCVVADAAPHRIVATEITPARLPSDTGCSAPVPWADIAADAPVSSGEAPAEVCAELDRALGDLRSRLRLPGLVAAVVVDGAVAAWSRAGYAEVATRRRPTRRTAVRLGSLSGALTALVVHRLAAEGGVALDDPLDRHLRSVRVQAAGSAVTVRHLLTHSAGLLPDPALPLGVPDGSAVPALTALVGETVTATGPVGRHVPNPLDHALLGQLVADVTGEPFERFAAEHVLDPLGLRRSSYLLDDRVARQPLCGYDVDFDEVTVAAGTEVVMRPAAGLASTLDDLARFAGLLCAAEDRSLVTPALPTAVAGVQVGLGGLYVADVRRGKLAWQVGGWPGALAGVWALPESGVALALAANAWSPARLVAFERVGTELALTLGELLAGVPAA